MALSRPTLIELRDQAQNDMRAQLNIKTIARRGFIGVLSYVLAGLIHMLYGFLNSIEKNALPDTAEGEFLLRWARNFDLQLRPATFAQVTVRFTGNEGVGIPQGTVLKNADNLEYITDASALIPASGEVDVDITATTPGRASNLLAGSVLSLDVPIAGVDSEIPFQSTIIEAEDAEDLESLRARLLERLANPINGGSATDYIQWAQDISGVTRSWVVPLYNGPGTVGVYIVEDDDASIVPSPAKITEVQDYINELKPVTADVDVLPPVLLPIDMTIAIRPNTLEVQDAITKQLEDSILRQAQLVGAYSGPGETFDGKILLSKLREAISVAVGEDDNAVILVNGAAPADITPTTNELATLGTITWQTLS